MRHLATQEIQEYIWSHLSTNVSQLVLRGVPFSSVTAQEIAQQIQGIKTMQVKTPDFVKKGIFFPPQKNLEQTSSQETALYKRSLLPANCNSLIDITGGFGIDLFYLSNGIEQVTYCELNSMLCELVQTNFSAHQRSVEVFNGSGINYLQTTENAFDCLFIDPSRRTSKGKIILLEESEPNIIEHWQLLLRKANRVIVKLSPMVDIEYLKSRLSNIREIHVVAVKQDVKEVLLVCERDYTGEVKHFATTIEGDNKKTFEDRPLVVELDEQINYKYIYEPYSVLLKANMQDAYAALFELKKADANTHLYFSDKLIDVPMCKRYEVLTIPQLNRKVMTRLLPNKKVDVVCKNYPLKPAEVLKKLAFKQGGEQTLLCFRVGKKAQSVLTKRV